MNEENNMITAYRRSLVVRTTEILTKTVAVRRKMDKIVDEIAIFNVRYPDDLVETLDWHEKEKFYDTVNSLLEQLNGVETELDKVEAEYVEICNEVNTFFGREVLPPAPNLPKSDLDDFDDADWWKNQ